MKKPFEQIPFNPARWPFFYGWMILMWGMIGVLLSVPGQTTGVSAFIEPLLESLGISRLELANAYMVGTLSSSFLLTPAGKLFDRIGARWMGFGSCLALGIVLVLLGQSVRIAAAITTLMPERFAVFGLFSLLFFMLRLSGQGILTMASRNMIMKWFDLRRGLASGITGAAVAYGFSYAPTLFSKMIGIHGWSGTWTLLGLLLIALFSPLLLVFFRDNPEACGLVPDGRELSPQERTKPEIHHTFTLAEARRTFAFWAFALTMALQALVLTAVTFNIESLFEQVGMDSAQGFALLPPAALISVAINLLGGWLSDRTQLRWFLAIMLMAMATYMTGLIFLKPGWVVWLIIASFGISNGLFGILMAVTWPRYYGREHLGAISGLCMTLMVVFSAVGPAFFSTVLKFMGSYDIALFVSLLAAGLLLAGSFHARNPQRDA
jgi:OFA family oxalate/formate antiporter-like MFS transporter